MLHTTNLSWPRISARTSFRSFGTAAVGLVALLLVAVASQSALAAAITITNQIELQFGRYAATQSQGGTVTINPATGGKTVTGALSDLGAAHQRARFTVTGDPDAAFSITLPSELTIRSGGDTMIVNAFTSSPSGSGVLDGTGNADLYVGGTLTISANQPAGYYVDNYAVVVNYQ